MRRTLYIHIGAHKTATTTIQRTFWQQRDLLAQREVLYPTTNHYHFAQHRLAFALKRQRDPVCGDIPQFRDEIMALRGAIETMPQSRAFISSEAFFTAPRQGLIHLRDALDFVDIRIIAVVRRQDDYLLSFYNHNARMVGNGFTRPLRTHITNPRGIAREISFLRWVQQWQRVFGDQTVSLLRYEDRNPLCAILDILGVPEALVSVPDHVNPSAPAAVAEAVRLAKRLGLPRPLQAAIYKVSGRLFAGGTRKRLSNQQRAHILSEFAEENKAMFAAFGMENTYNPGP